MLNAVLYPLAAAVAWSAALYKLPAAARRPRDPAVIALTAAIAVLGLVFTISTPAVWTAVDREAGWPNLSFLLSQGLVMVWTVAVQVLMVLWAYPTAARSRVLIRVAVAAATVAAMVTLFSLAPLMPEDSTNFAARYAGSSPYISAYLCVYVVAFAWMQGEIVFLCLRTIRVGGKAWMRRGLRATAAGAGLGLVYCLVRASDVVAATTGAADPARWENIARLAVGVGVLCPPIGWTMPAWGPRLDEARGWAVRVYAYWRLYPLWSVLYSTFGSEDLDPPRGLAARVAFKDLKDWLLVRRLTFIWDCMLQLEQYRSPVPALPEPAGGAGERRPGIRRHGGADAEAEALLAALRSYQQSHAGSSAPPAPSRTSAQPPEEASWEQLSGELGRLIALSRAVSHHPAQAARPARETAPAGNA